MELHEKAILPKGFSCCGKHVGLKADKSQYDLTVIYSDSLASAAGVFTLNKFPGAPITVGREIIKDGKLRAVVINSKISNVGTGEQGLENARRMGRAVAKEFGISEREVIMSSTGVIGKQLLIDLIEKGIVGVKDLLQKDPLEAAKGIMTTDTYPKAISTSVGDATLTIVGKGSGMIEPNMATMLVYVLTDAEIDSATVDTMLRKSVDKSFNMLSVDTDTSTSDTCLFLANGQAGKVDENEFQIALDQMCIEMTKMLASDGEGATKLITINVQNALDKKESRVIAKSLVNSPLIKTMAYGADPNIGRVLMAVGKCFDCTINHDVFSVQINGSVVFANGERKDFDEDKVRKLLSGKEVNITVNIGAGDACAIAYGCDYTEGYIKENASYYSS